MQSNSFHIANKGFESKSSKTINWLNIFFVGYYLFKSKNDTVLIEFIKQMF